MVRSVALVDAASDGATYNFSDVLEVIRYMQARDNVPTWVIGGSSSTGPIANLAVNLPADMPVGAIFFSPGPPYVPLVGLIRRPTFVRSITRSIPSNSEPQCSPL